MDQGTRRDRTGSVAEGPGPAAVAGRRPGDRVRNRLRPSLLPLEDRRLLSTFDVTSAADDGSIGTLRGPYSRPMRPPLRARSISISAVRRRRSRWREGKLELSNTAEPTTITGPGAGWLTINGNRADGVFQVDRTVSASLSGLTITRGSTGNHGGGVINSGSLMLSGCTISGNSSQYGGGLFNEGTATLIECTISGNTAQSGGGVYNAGTVSLTNCTIGGNSGQNGGGLTNYAAATLTECTIAFNTARSHGGGLSNSGNGPGNQTTLTLTACTITGNSAPTGGGLYNHDGLANPAVATLTDTIVARNSATGRAPGDIGGRDAANVTGSFNLFGTGGSGGVEGGIQGNIVLVEPHRPGPGRGGRLRRAHSRPSPSCRARGHRTGTPIVGLATDQRGFALDLPRPDIGAFQSRAVPLVVGAATDDGSITRYARSAGPSTWPTSGVATRRSPSTRPSSQRRGPLP